MVGNCFAAKLEHRQDDVVARHFLNFGREEIVLLLLEAGWASLHQCVCRVELIGSSDLECMFKVVEVLGLL